MNRRDEMLAERAELIAKNEAATSWGAAVGARSERIKEINRHLAALDAEEKHLFQAEPGYVVKPLRWEKHPDDDEWYSYDEGHYQVSDYVVDRNPASTTAWRMRVHGYLLEQDFESLDAAKAAAQADYEQRIRSAITATVGTAEPGYVAGFEACRAAAVKITKPWPGFPTQDSSEFKLSDVEKAVVDIRQNLSTAIAALPAPATAFVGEEVTAEEFGLALMALPNELPPAFFHRGSGVRETVANDIARRLKVEFAITKRG